MSICLCRRSADIVLERMAHEGTKLQPASSDVLRNCTANTDDMCEWFEGQPEFAAGDIEVLVNEERRYRGNTRAVCHKVYGPLPEDSLYQVDEGLYVVTPELCLVQQALELHFIRLCQMLGRYLGTASSHTNSEGASKLKERLPLTTEEKLGTYLSRLKGHRGALIVREAMRWTCPLAASPQETNLQLALTLPHAWGGFQLGRPRMNYEIKLSSVGRKMYDRKTCRIDLYWPQSHFGLEYLGPEHRDTLESDCSRFYALLEKGAMTWNVTKEQMASAEQMSFIARGVARKTRRKISDKWPDETRVQMLLDALTGPSPSPNLQRMRARRAI